MNEFKVPSFAEWFASEHAGRSFEDHYFVCGSSQAAVFKWHLLEIEKYSQAVAQLSHDHLVKDILGQSS